MDTETEEVTIVNRSKAFYLFKRVSIISRYHTNLYARATPTADTAIPRPLKKARVFLPKLFARPAPAIEANNRMTPIPTLAEYSFNSIPMSSRMFTV